MPHEPPTGTPVVTQEMIRLYDDYTHLSLDRRGFLDSLRLMAGSAAAAAAVLPLIAADSARAQMIPADDPRLATATVTWPGTGGEMAGYLASPADATGPLPGVIVIHENRGLNDHIRDVARRFALEGYVALAPDFLAPGGGTPADEDAAREAIRALDPAAVDGNLVATSAFLRQHEATTGAVAVVGFCWGGSMANALAVADPDLRAAVAFYGSPPDAARVPAIRASLLLHNGELDERIMGGMPGYEAALDAAGTDYVAHTYPGANHAFFNDTSAARYDPAAAALAWERTLAFLKDKLA